MATLPSASSTLDETGAGIAVGDEPMAIISCMEKGPTNTVRPTQKTQDTLDEFGRGEGLELAGFEVDIAAKPYLFVRCATAVPAVISSSDNEGVLTGTSVITFTGTPFDDEEIVLEVVESGTVATGGTVRVSRDGGYTWGGNIRLGTANTYTIPGTGIAANFAAGTLVKGETARCFCTAPRPDAAGVVAALNALASNIVRPRIVVICGDVQQASDLQSILDAATAFEVTHGKRISVLVNGKDINQPVAMQGNPADVDFDATLDTITRGTGSWVTDGFEVGQAVTIAGSVSNNASHVVTNVTATVLTVAASPGLVTEANVNGVGLTITGAQSKSAWRAELETIVGNTPPTQKINYRVGLYGGRGRRLAPISATRKRRPAAWGVACIVMSHDVHTSAAQVDLGDIGWSLHDNRGTLVEHDERVDGGLLSMRIGGFRTYNDKPGVFVSLPLTLDEDNKPLSRLPIVLTGQLIASVAQKAYTEKLNSNVLRNPNGTIRETEARRIEQYVQSQLEAVALVPGPEGPRASLVKTTLSRGVNIVPGALVPWQVDFVSLGYLEQLPGVVRVA